MKKEMLKNSEIFVVILLFIGASFLSGVSAISTDNKDLKNYNQEIINPENDGTEYWALLVAVGVYAENPEQDRPLMLEEVDDLYDLLL